MITEKELRIVDGLRIIRDETKSLLDSFFSQYVEANIGIVDVNSAAKHKPQPSEHAYFFHNSLEEIKNELTELAIEKLKHKLKETELELSKYINKDS